MYQHRYAKIEKDARSSGGRDYTVENVCLLNALVSLRSAHSECFSAVATALVLLHHECCCTMNALAPLYLNAAAEAATSFTPKRWFSCCRSEERWF